MGGLSPWHWAIIIVVALLLFGGRGKLSGVMGDAARGIRAFKDELKAPQDSTLAEPRQLPSQSETKAGAAVAQSTRPA